jgi:ABC-2 type transport system permease protein
VSRASFRLVAAYLGRDRDVKLRVYPGIAPMLALPVMILLPAFSGSGERSAGGGVAFAGVYLLLVPQMALEMLVVSQHWQAADVFRLVPVPGPAAITHGMRRAVLFLLALPTTLIYAALILTFGSPPDLVMLLPGIIALPVFAMIPCLSGRVIPFSQPPNVRKATTRMMYYIGSMVTAAVIAGLAAFARSKGWLAALLIVETIVAGTVYFTMRHTVDRARWASLE